MGSRVKWFIVASICLLAGTFQAAARETYLQFAQRMNAAPGEGVQFRPDLERELLRLANAYRAGKGVKPLAANARQLMAARAHAMDMAQNDFVGHMSSNGNDFESRMHALRPGELFLPSMAENAARASDKSEPGPAKAAGLMKQWINSTPHRKALGSRSYISVATAVVQKGRKLYAVEIFVGPEVKTNLRQAGSGLY